MADIFISYSKASRAQTEELAKYSQAHGLTVWWDTSLVPCDSFRNVILSELQQARAAIVMGRRFGAIRVGVLRGTWDFGAD
jgi:TIR domain-containing protein